MNEYFQYFLYGKKQVFNLYDLTDSAVPYCVVRCVVGYSGPVSTAAN